MENAASIMKELKAAILDFDEDKIVGLDVGKILPVYFVYRDDVLIKRFVGEKSIDELEREILYAD